MYSIYNRLLFVIAVSIIGAPPAAVALRYNAKNTIVIGHLKPDADSIGGAIAAAYYFDVKAGRTGPINKETKFLLDKFSMPVPELITDFEGKNIIAVDFNQKSQAPKEFAKGTLVRVIDHHALLEAPVTSQKPIPVDIKPWGSVCTVITRNFFIHNNRAIPKDIAGMLLGGIISDTLNLRSQTTTKFDREMVKYLAPIADVTSIKNFAREMFKAKSDISDLSDRQILEADFKDFYIGGKKIGIGVAETVMPKQTLDRKDGIIKEALKMKKEGGYDYIFFFVINLSALRSKLITIDLPEQKVGEKLFGGATNNNILNAQKFVSRKLHIVPMLMDYFSKD